MAKGCINQIDEHSDKVPKEENLYFLGDAFEETELSIVLQRNLFYNSFKIFFDDIYQRLYRTLQQKNYLSGESLD